MPKGRPAIRTKEIKITSADGTVRTVSPFAFATKAQTDIASRTDRERSRREALIRHCEEQSLENALYLLANESLTVEEVSKITKLPVKVLLRHSYVGYGSKGKW